MKEKRFSISLGELDELKQQGGKLSSGEEMEFEVNGVKMVVSRERLWQFECRFGTFGADLITVQRKS